MCKSAQVHDSVAYSGGEVDASFVLLLEANVGRSLVEADSEALQLVLDQLLVSERLQDVQDDQDQVAGTSHWNTGQEKSAELKHKR